MKLYAHPFSSYSQKVLIALYENATPFEYRNLEEPAANAELAAPSLFYADWAHEIPAGYGRLRAYRACLLNHPSIVRVVEEAMTFRHYFPLGALARD
ncbi:glutathione S-transferase N-terminal domain-containing protein [Aeromonas hydrophila]|nr:glutathione S-transferase N-terminal domain-containing protein [Aeromonas hydrophila]